eukprot:CAMPEP_0179976220 /NCGR_PEP_ID=MMETSP0983-20121128/39245_1 /TAXON_ID=483367 /ORGANISM="non described non described, Strain CCMP 2436" /LENGTH=213 /DNA_ID=CAMNT_0021892997 /DNA_START=247 /DNA_END=888 /DNA_ORIENTATION=-
MRRAKSSGAYPGATTLLSPSAAALRLPPAAAETEHVVQVDEADVHGAIPGQSGYESPFAFAPRRLQHAPILEDEALFLYVCVCVLEGEARRPRPRPLPAISERAASSGRAWQVSSSCWQPSCGISAQGTFVASEHLKAVAATSADKSASAFEQSVRLPPQTHHHSRLDVTVHQPPRQGVRRTLSRARTAGGALAKARASTFNGSSLNVPFASK